MAHFVTWNESWIVDIPEIVIPVLRSHDLILQDGVDARRGLLTSGSEVGRSDFFRLRHCRFVMYCLT